MAAAIRDIKARISLDGEAQWKSEMNAATRQLKNLDSELKVAQEEFKGNANSIEALTKKHELLKKKQEQQTKVVETLEQAVEDASDAWGENSTKTDAIRRQYNYAKAALAKLNNELDDNEKYLDEASHSADQCAKSIDNFGKKTKGATGSGGGASGLLSVIGNLIPGAKNLSGILGGGLTSGAVGAAAGFAGVAGAAVGVAQWMLNLVDETAELRTSLAKLESAAGTAGVAFDEDLKESLVELYTIADGDWDSAFEALHNLLQAGYDSELPEMIELLGGAVAMFPDTLNIESLADSLQETVATASATGQFSELLERLGLDTDVFNTSLQAATSETDRLQVAMTALAQGGLAETYEAYQANNAAQLALTEAQANLELANAQLAESFVPLKTWITNVEAGFSTFLAQILESHNHGGTILSALSVGLQSGAAAGDEAGVSMSRMFEILNENDMTFGELRDAAKDAGMGVGEYINALDKATDGSNEMDTATDALTQELPRIQSAANNAATAMNNYATAARNAASASGSVGGLTLSQPYIAGSHAAGLNYVPYDGYIAELHRGEQVLTARQAADYRTGSNGGSSVVVNVTAASLSQAQVDYLIARVNRELGGMI